MSSTPKKEDSVAVRPSGTVTFLMTDVEGSSKLWEANPAAMKTAMTRHHVILEEMIVKFGGYQPEEQGEGDSLVGAFARATDAVACALEAQMSLVSEPWPEGVQVLVRMGLHSGEAELRDERNYAGGTINRCARLRAIGHGGQTLVSGTARHLAGDNLPEGTFLKDLGLHRLKDLAAPEQVWQLCHPSLREEFPPLNSLEALPNNLPAQLTVFIGREEEIGEVEELAANNRLVTLTGAAGCGKTRLALHVTAEMLERFPDGVWLVDLAPVADPELVVYSVASAMGLRMEVASSIAPGMTNPGARPERPPITRVVDHIRSRSIVLVLDNCEHLIGACADVADTLLRQCPNVRILATSREPLGVGGEATYRVPSLSVPDERRLPPPEDLAQLDAVRLFVDRARLRESAFSLTAENATPIAQICHRLDGIPLAIELAAARVGALTPRQIADRLGEAFRLLTGGARTTLERQQTLRAAVDWSHRLLSDPEAMLLRRLSIFAGGFTLEAAEEICAGESGPGEVLDLLTLLVDKSLVIKERAGDVARYRLLETIRQYAREKLVESGEVETFRTCHRDWFLAVAERAEPEMESSGLAFWLRALEADLDNLRAALEWSLTDSDPGPALQLASALGLFWSLRGYRQEGKRWLDEALARAADAAPLDRARALTRAADLALLDVEELRGLVEESMEASTAAGYHRGIVRSLYMKAQLSFLEGFGEDARSFLEEGLALARRDGDRFMEGRILHFLAQLLLHLDGDRAASLRHHQQGMAVARELGSQLGIARAVLALAQEADRDADFEAEERLLTEGLAIARATGDISVILHLLIQLSRLAGYRGDEERERSLWEEATATARDSGDVIWFEQVALGAEDKRDFSEARRWWHEAATALRDSSRVQSEELLYVLGQQGMAAFLEGDVSAARALLEEALQRSSGGASKVFLAADLRAMGEVKLALGETAEARVFLEESIAIARETGSAYVLAASLLFLSKVERSEGRLDDAGALVRESLEIQAVREPRNAAFELEALAGVWIDAGDHARAARLLGAAEAIRQTFHHRMTPVYMAAHEKDLAAVRAALGQDGFAEAWAEGRAMPLEDAVAFALERRGTPATE